MKKILRLTDAQMARIPEWVDKWVAIGLSTEPANFEEAEKGVRGCYASAGLAQPTVVLRMSSPYGAVVGGAMAALLLGGKDVRSQVRSRVWSQVALRVDSQAMSQVESHIRSQVDSQVWSQVWSQVDSQVDSPVEWQVASQVRSQVDSQVESKVWSQAWSQVGSQIRSQVWSQVTSQVWSQADSQIRSQVESQVRSQIESQVDSQIRSQVRSQIGSRVDSEVWTQVWSEVGSPVWAQVGSQVRSQIESQVRSQLGGAWSQYRGGNLWASWYAYISFFRDVCGWDDETLQYFAHDERHALHASWCWYHDRVAAISDRPERILRDDQGRLHSESGMALQYRDGWGLWMWHGVAVDEQIIMRPETQTLEQINREENAEVKRIRIERYGWERYLTAVGAAVVDRRRNDVEGTREALMRAGDMQALVCHCPSTGRVYALEVPMEVQTCEQAQGYLWSGSRLLADRQINIIGRT